MFIEAAIEADYPAIIELVNAAYRGRGAEESWNIESGILEGTRLTDSLLREDLATKPEAHLLVHRDAADGTILGTVWLEPAENGAWYLGLFTVSAGATKSANWPCISERGGRICEGARCKTHHDGRSQRTRHVDCVVRAAGISKDREDGAVPVWR